MASIFVTTETELVLYPLHRKQSAYVCVVVFYRSRCLAMDGRSDSDIPAFRLHATILIKLGKLLERVSEIQPNRV
jgi:hypothetical protein